MAQKYVTRASQQTLQCHVERILWKSGKLILKGSRSKGLLKKIEHRDHRLASEIFNLW